MSVGFVESVIVICCILLWLEADCSCPPISKCVCLDLKSKGKTKFSNTDGTKLKCSRIDKIEDLLLHDFLNVSSYVVQLDLSNNNIITVPHDGFPLADLTKLDLDKNSIQYIEDGAFSGLRKLKTLILSNNKITSLMPNSFVGLVSLETLKLNQNLIRRISSNVFDELKSLSKLNITGNPLTCDCDLWWLRTSNIKLTPTPICQDPPSLRGQPLEKITQDNGCEWRSKSVYNVVLEPNDDQIVYEGDSLRIVCRVESSKDEYDLDVNLTWMWAGKEATVVFKDSIKLQSLDVKTDGIPESTLIVEEILAHHTGEWSCNLTTRDYNTSKIIRIAVITKNTLFCNMSVTENNKGRYVWPETFAGRRIQLSCYINEAEAAEGLTYNAWRICTANATWGDANTDNCPYMSSVTRILQQFSKMNLTKDKASLIESATRLRNFTNDNLANMTNVVDIHFLVRTIENYIGFLNVDSELGSLLMEIVSFSLKLPRSSLEEAEQQHIACSRMLSVIEAISKDTPNLDFQNNDLAVKQIQISSDFAGISCSWFKTSLTEKKLSLLNCSTANDTSINSMSVDASIQVPQYIYSRPETDASQPISYILMIAVFKDNRLFPDKRINKVGSTVVTANLIGVKITKLDEPIYVMVKNRGRKEPILSRWESETSSWSKDSCHRLPSLGFRNALLIYSCYQTGYFTLLSDADDVDIVNTDNRIRRQLDLNVLLEVAYVSTFVTVMCLLLTSLTYFFNYSYIQMSKKMKHSLTNTWISAMLFFLVFSIGIYETEHETICQSIGITIHYFALATLFWMAVTVKALYKRVQKSHPSMSTPSEDMPGDAIKKPILGIYLVGWGISSILCGISAAVNIRGYSTSSYCFLTPGPALSTIIIPASLVLFYLVIMCLLVKCATSGLDSNPQLSVGTQAIDLEYLDGGRNSFVPQGSVRSVTTPSSQCEDTEHSPERHLKAFVIFLVLYLLTVISAACCVMVPFRVIGEQQAFGIIYAFTSTALGVFTVLFHGLARNDVRYVWSRWLAHETPRIVYTQTTPEPAPVIPRTDFAKKAPAINLMRIHRENYCNWRPTTADTFYNPQQSIVAKKFFRKQRKKRGVPTVRRCRSGGGSPVECVERGAVCQTDDETTHFLRSPLTYDEPGTGGNAGTDTEATFTLPEYAEIAEPERSRWRAWSDRASDVNSEPTYNYASVGCGARSASDASSTGSHLYAAVAPDVVSSSVDRYRPRRWRQSARAGQGPRIYARRAPKARKDYCASVDRRRKEQAIAYGQLRPMFNPSSEISSEDKVETRV